MHRNFAHLVAMIRSVVEVVGRHKTTGAYALVSWADQADRLIRPPTTGARIVALVGFAARVLLAFLLLPLPFPSPSPSLSCLHELLEAMAQHSAQTDGLCLRYPEALGSHAQVSQEQSVQMLLRATQLAQHTPFTWTYIDKPSGERPFSGEGRILMTLLLQRDNSS